VTEVRLKHSVLPPTDSYLESLRKAGLTPPTKQPWGIAILVVGAASGLGQLFLGNAFLGFIVGSVISLLLYWGWSKKK
jgi:hypothetical protein